MSACKRIRVQAQGKRKYLKFSSSYPTAQKNFALLGVGVVGLGAPAADALQVALPDSHFTQAPSIVEHAPPGGIGWADYHILKIRQLSETSLSAVNTPTLISTPNTDLA